MQTPIFPLQALVFPLAILFAIAWIGFALMMLKMLIAGFRAGEPSWPFNPMIFTAGYNARNLRILIGCFLVMVLIVIAGNVLSFTGQIDLVLTTPNSSGRAANAGR